ncbi:MAG: hypothetical protein EOO88_08925 [Pedobacter sp.]|nr:MAG: hypothetical protein EOO88_08925 [Pedobacter sp.]
MGVSQDAGALSQSASINMDTGLPLPAGQVLAYPSDKKGVIKWDLPAGEKISKIRIYRSMLGTPSVLLKELSGSVSHTRTRRSSPGKLIIT